MGGGISKDKKTQQIEAEMKKQQKIDDDVVKLLLLGAGNSGKSTIFKQMRYIYGDDYTATEREDFKRLIITNVFDTARALLEGSSTLTGLPAAISEAALESGKHVTKLMEDDLVLTPEAAGHVKTLWEDPCLQAVWERRAELQIIDSFGYFANHLDRIGQLDYSPMKEDILMCRVRTTGIIEEKYTIDKVPFAILDVGGQRNERRKWMHYFDGVTALIFVAALSEYDQKMYEVENKNRMIDALELFHDIINKEPFKSKSAILFMNKKDLFMEKITKVDIASVPEFSDYSGPSCDYNSGVNYFLQKFQAANENDTREVYHHVTQATDTENVGVVFNACKDIILRQNLASSFL